MVTRQLKSQKWLWTGVLSGLLVWSAPGYAQTPPAPALLTKVLQEGTLGLDYEETDYQRQLENQARVFSRLVKTDAGRTLLESRFPGCSTGSRYSVFCEIPASLLDPRFGQTPTPKLSKAWKLKLRSWFSSARLWIQNGEMNRFKDFSLNEVQLILKSMRGIEDLNQLGAKLDEVPACTVPALDLLLANRLEEFFPAADSFSRAMHHYERVSSCPNDDLADKASYRLSMIQVLNHQCSEARSNLERLAYWKPSKDYGSRSLYWLAHCEEQVGGLKAAEIARRVLLETYPFSLHNLLLQSEDPVRVKSVVSKADSAVQFRTERHPHLNTRLAVLESLLKIHEGHLAARILNTLVPELEGTEPEFQLYIAALFNRVQDNVNKFRILSVLFRAHPEMISRATMELYYPHREFNSVDTARVQTDRYLILSLIRQESAFNERARSPAGALGLMQVLPRTARRIEAIGPKDLYDPAANVRIGTKYIAGLIHRYGGDVELALAAYNAGTARVEEWEKRYPVENRLLFIDLIPFKETREYVSSIARNYFWYNFLYSETHGKTESKFKLFGAASNPDGLETAQFR